MPSPDLGEPDDPLLIGDVVEIHGLVGAPELNGRQGQIVAFVETTQRFGVRLDAESKAVKAANLRKISSLQDDRIVKAERISSTSSVVRPQLSSVPDREKHPEIFTREAAWKIHRSLSPPPNPPRSDTIEYTDRNEYPDPNKASRYIQFAMLGLAGGVVLSQADLCSPTWFVWSFLLVHLTGAVLTDSAEPGLLALCLVFGVHGGVALSEVCLWVLDLDGEDSVGPWSIVVLFGCFLYLQSLYVESVTLPPDYITSISLFFPTFPAYNAAVVMSCLELFAGWRYFPEHKFHWCAVVLGALLMLIGQVLISFASRAAHRNFWASCRNAPEEETLEEFAGLEIPNRRIVKEGPFRWERHPAYFGAMLWGVGVEVTLCNPGMLCVVGFVLWASLLYVALEEEQELYDEFKAGYAHYAATTRCWIPMFNSFLESAAFQREMGEHTNANEEVEEVDDEEDCDEEASEDDLLPTWEGVPKGGALWNRQFRDPWVLG